MQHPTATYFATISNDAVRRTANTGSEYTAFGIVMHSCRDGQDYYFNVVAFGNAGRHAASLQRGLTVKLRIQAHSQPDNDATIPLLTAVFVEPLIPDR